jgi:hypothetical protein
VAASAPDSSSLMLVCSGCSSDHWLGDCCELILEQWH